MDKQNNPRMTKNDIKIDEISKISRFLTFLCNFLSNFRESSCIRMLITFNKGRIHCPVVFFEETNAVFSNKNLKLSQTKWMFLLFSFNFCKISEKVQGLECSKCSKMKELAMQYSLLRTLHRFCFKKNSEKFQTSRKTKNFTNFTFLCNLCVLFEKTCRRMEMFNSG